MTVRSATVCFPVYQYRQLHNTVPVIYETDSFLYEHVIEYGSHPPLFGKAFNTVRSRKRFLCLINMAIENRREPRRSLIISSCSVVLL